MTSASSWIRSGRRAAPSLVLMALMGLLLPKPADAGCERLFADQVSYLSGAKPVGTVAGDFNEDGVADLAVANLGGGTISVLLGRGANGVGDGTFGSQVTYAMGGTPVYLVTGDFNEDGILDLAAADLSGGAVAVLLGRGSAGTGDGTFAAPVRYAAGSDPWDLIVGDFNEDGISDLAVTDNHGGTVAILRGLGSGGLGNGAFAAPVLYSVSAALTHIVTHDFNHDGIADLAVAGQAPAGVAIMLGRGSAGVGDGTFSPPTVYPSTPLPFSLAVGDFNQDGIADLAAGDDSYNGVAILAGNGSSGVGDGTFGPPVFVYAGRQAAAVAAGDWDQNGVTDLAIGDDIRGLVAILPGLGSGGVSFGSETDYAVGSVPIALVVGDFNEDSRHDLVVACRESNDVSVLLGHCTRLGPMLTDVRDVPSDQGGRVFVTWLRSGLDDPALRTITAYRVWRRVIPARALAGSVQGTGAAAEEHLLALPVSGPDGSLEVTYWEALATLPAEGLAGYGYAAATTQDSMHAGNPYTAFFVSALTADPFTFYQSEVDSGYSVDNLAPPTPVPFTATYGAASNALHWAASRAPDLGEFRLYRGTSAIFVPDASTLVGSTRDTGYVDISGAYHYKLVAVDVHGNLSRYAAVAPNLPAATLATLVNLDAGPDRVRLTWYSGNAALAARVYRRTVEQAWVSLGETVFDGSGHLRYEDRSVAPGTRYGYRLGIMEGGTETFAGEVWATAERPGFALEAVRPNPSQGEDLTVQFVLPAQLPARLELFDVAGRRVAAREVGSLGPGRHAVDLARGTRLAPGWYEIRLSQGAEVRRARAAVLR